MRKGGIVIVLGCLTFITEALEVRCYPFPNLNYTRHRHRRHSEEEGCTLPPFPEHGDWKVLNGEGKAGDKIPKNSVVKFDCSIGYKLSHTAYRVCDEKWASKEFPVCEGLCPPLSSTPTTHMRCMDKRAAEVACNEATEGTYLFFNCTDFYEIPFGVKKTLYCSDGSWSGPKPVCQPVCGKIIVNDAKPLIYGSKPNERLEYPWVTAVYSRANGSYENICGGSILSLTVVVTAAHCVTNDFGDKLPEENYLVGAGKIYNKYQAPEDEHAQYLEVSKIIVHDSYKGDRKRYSGDLAVLVTKGLFILNDVIQPVCFNNVDNIYLHAGSIGEISGWGKTEDGLASNVLRTLKIPYKYETTCAQELPRDWADKYNMVDKICAGFFGQNTSVCSGDSGSGLAFKNPDDTRYYIHGLVSLGPTTKLGDCDIQQNALYTKVAFYYEFIDRLLAKYAVDIKDCRLPSFPQNGKWTIDKQQKKPGDAVPSNTILKVKCDLGYKLSSPKNSIECGSAHVMPTCQLLCPVLTFPSGTDFRCTNKEGKTINCLDAVDGSTLNYGCPGDYRFPEGTASIRSCVEGSWGSPHPACIKEGAKGPTKGPTTDSPYSPTPTRSSTFPPLTPGPIGGEEDESVMVICVYAASRYYETNVDPDDLDSSLCTHVLYSSIGLAADGSLKVQGSPVPAGGSRSLFHKVADMKIRNPKLKVLLSVEGSGDKNAEYPTMAADAEKRSTFIRSAASFMEIYKFDGLDINWRSPQSDDRDLYISLLKEVKAAFKSKGWLLTASVYLSPTYIGYNPGSMYEIIDWINLQNYDGYTENSMYTGQFSAFRESSKEGEWDRQLNNLVNAGQNWQDRGMLKNKIALSIAFYGRYYTLQDPKKHGIHSPTVRGESGLLTYSEICQKHDSWRRVWDDEQKNPYKYSGNKWFGYDDPKSVKIKLKCTNRNGTEVGCNEATEGTYLTFHCAPFYETPFGYKKSLLCSGGKWNYPNPICQPVCGKKIVKDARPTIYGVKPNKRLEYPWVVAVYDNKENGSYKNICGGSILSLSVVLTAAHCVTNDYGDTLPKENYLVGAGKLHNKYQAPEDRYAQYLEISKIIVHDQYNGDRKRFLANIAVLVTKKIFTLNEVVQPVCFNDVHNIPLHAGSIGEMSGWGKTENGTASEVLRTLKIPYKYETTCSQELPRDWADKYNSVDKICAGFINQSISVCDGDSGSGLAFENSEDNRYYVHGIVSLGPTTKEDECDIQQNSLYTKVAFYYEFIDRLLAKYAVDIKDCRLPSFPQNGKWMIDKQQRNPGDAVPSNTILKVQCNLGYKLSSPQSIIECGSAHVMPSCQLLCPTLTFPHQTDFRCTSKEGNTINCLEAVDGSTLHYNCPGGYKFPEGTARIRSCVEGSWGSPEPACIWKGLTTIDLTTSSPVSIASPVSANPTLSTIPSPWTPSPPDREENKRVRVICSYAASRYYETNVDPDDLESSLCTHVIYSSMRLAADGSIKVQGSPVPPGGTKSLFQKVADMKVRNPKLKVLLSVYGTGEKGDEYPTMAADPEKRSTFVRSAVSFLEAYKFDGLDVNWIAPKIDDSGTFITLLKEVKKALKPKGFLLSASVYVTTFYLGYLVNPMNEILDWINVQNYNGYNEISKYTGQYSAFQESEKERDWFRQFFNMINAGNIWQRDGMDKNKIALSIAFYGRYFTLQDPNKHGLHASTIPEQSGLLTYSEICQKYDSWTRVWDGDQKNPYKYFGNKWFGYDDPESIKIKTEHIKREGFFGVHIHSVDADDVQGKCGPKQGLLKYVRQVLGYPVQNT